MTADTFCAGNRALYQQERRQLGVGGIGKRCVIGFGSPVEGLAQLAHLLGHRKVADADLAQGMVELADEDVEQGLGSLGGLRPLAFQPVQQQDHVQAIEFETALDRVGDAEFGVEQRLAGALHGRVIELLPDNLGAALAEQALKH